ncbi:Aldo/keto reductase [Schizophyllum commune H4-8]|uniref:NADP-dependent oxidoreductase domain-containing protein n=1 Tax=Schizophyllum commune (strain H4-8 / FGSC 9210) TaxID=578458 RepID=D8PSY8_SCHCM|nr:Aldo/keto reductase [Schizophyllum commune H4-8]KAI5899498.1 Aldo/keto reductase [Schizophyllum commune H4-8]
MSPTTATFKLSSGTEIPWLAWGNGSGDARKTAVESGRIALEAGIRHIDTAQGYKNEDATGEVVKGSNLKKDDVFVTTKLSGRADDKTQQGTPEYVHGVNDIRTVVKGSIDRLGFIPDLFLIHNPNVVARSDLKATWRILEDLKDSGELKDIGVSNFRPQDLEIILEDARHKPVVNQLEYHPYVLAHLQPVLDIQAKHGILTEAYGPLTPLLRHPTGGPLKPVLQRIAQRISADNKSLTTPIDAVTVLLLWTRASGAVAVTASGNPDRIRGLAAIAHLPGDLLKPEEVEEITRVGKTVHYRHYREHMTVDFPAPSLPDGTN